MKLYNSILITGGTGSFGQEFVTNFFEKRVGDYGKMDEDAHEIDFDEDF